MQLSNSLREVLPRVIYRVRALFDLDADPAAINNVLHSSFPGGDGLGVPGTLDGYGWTAQYIAMRALRWPDAFTAGDVALHKMLNMQARKSPDRKAEETSLAWQPWRSYAVVRAWSGLLGATYAMQPPPTTALLLLK